MPSESENASGQSPAGPPGPVETGGPAGGRRRRIAASAVLLLFALAILFFLWRGCAGNASSNAPEKGPPALPVAVAVARAGAMNIYRTGLGTVTALNTATLRTRVDGEVVQVTFLEGRTVRAGELLVQIDPRPFEAQVAQAEGQLARDQAILKNARLDLRRNQEAKAAVSNQQLATQAALVAQYEGVVKADEAQVSTARIYLTYCRIVAPFDGRIGLRLVDVGNVVHATDAGGLAVITQVRPITVVFTLPQDDIGPVQSRMRESTPIPVEAWDRDLGKNLAVGTLLAIDNQIDTASGTARFKAIFPNEGDELFPNQFVMARLLLEVLKNTILIPASAVQHGANATFVFVVAADGTVRPRNVRIVHTEGATMAIGEGLAAGERVVTEGLDRLREGMKVQVREEAAGPGPGPTP